MKLHSFAWALVQLLGYTAVAKDSRGHVRIRGLQVPMDPLLEEPFEGDVLVPGTFGDGLVMAGKKNSGGGGSKGANGDPDSACCAGKPKYLIFKYTASNCDGDGVIAQNAEKDGKADCEDNGGSFPMEDVTIDIVDKNGDAPLNPIITVDKGETFKVQFEDKFESNTFLSVRKAGIEFQHVQIHTSCSVPLDLFLNWGAFQLMDYG